MKGPRVRDRTNTFAAPEGHKKVVFQLDDSSRPTDRPQTKVERPEIIRRQKEWYDGFSEAPKDRIRQFGATVLAETWLAAEILVGVPEDNFDARVDDLQSIPEIVGYYIPPPIVPSIEPLDP